jgi:hypothetical protein
MKDDLVDPGGFGKVLPLVDGGGYGIVDLVEPGGRGSPLYLAGGTGSLVDPRVGV